MKKTIFFTDEQITAIKKWLKDDRSVRYALQKVCPEYNPNSAARALCAKYGVYHVQKVKELMRAD